MKKTNKKGWIRIVEAFMAIVILLGFLLLMLGQMNKSNNSNSAIEENNAKILSGIESNLTLRNEVLSSSVPINSSSPGFSPILLNYLNNNTLPVESCLMNICPPESECQLSSEPNSNIYSSEVLVSANATLYSPRKVKVFCYND